MIREKWKLIDYFFVFVLMASVVTIMVVSASVMEKVFNPQKPTGLVECNQTIIENIDLSNIDPRIIADKRIACELLYGETK